MRLGADYKPIDAEEAIRFGTYFRQFINSWELLYLQARLGVLDKSFLESKSVGYMEIMRFPGLRRWWEKVGSAAYEEDFVGYVQSKYQDLA